MRDNARYLDMVRSLRALIGPPLFPVPPIIYEHPERETPAGFRDHGVVDHRTGRGPRCRRPPRDLEA